MKRFKPDAKALGFLRIVTAVTAFALCFVSAVTLRRYVLVMYIAVGIVAATAFALDFIIYPLYFAKVLYHVSRDQLVKQTGVFFSSKEIMKQSSIQYVSVIRTPFSKFTSLNFIVLHALGAKISLHFIASEKIDELLETFNTQP